MGKLVTTSHISDTHNDFSFLTGSGHILFHHGDATNGGTEKEIERFGEYLKRKLNDFDHIVYIPGNHDKLFESNTKLARSIVGESSRLHVLINQSVELFDFKIFGSPFSQTFGSWSFMKYGEALFKEWDKIPKDVEILITHSPPFGILDYSGFSSGGHLGCQNLMYRIENDYKHLLLHGFGHIHEGYGVKEKDGKVFLNAAVAGSLHRGPFNGLQVEWEDKQVKEILVLED